MGGAPQVPRNIKGLRRFVFEIIEFEEEQIRSLLPMRLILRPPENFGSAHYLLHALNAWNLKRFKYTYSRSQAYLTYEATISNIMDLVDIVSISHLLV